MENLLKNWNMDRNNLNNLATINSERKNSQIEDENEETMRFLEYNVKDYDEEGFIKIESTSRIKILRDKESKPALLQNLQENFQYQVVQSTYAPSTKKKKLKNKLTTKVQSTKLKFLSIANVKSDWMEVTNFNLPNISKMKVDFEVEKLKDVRDTLFQVNKNIFNIKPKKPFPIKNPSETISFPHDIFEDKFLMDIYSNLEVKENEFAFFMPDYVFNTLSTINKKNFPWNMKVVKENNKFILFGEISEENPFLIFQTYNENNINDLNEDEIKIASENQESTLVEENFYRLLSDKKNLDSINQNYQYVKITLDGNLHIYTRINYDALDEKNNDVFLRTFNTMNISWMELNKNSKLVIDKCLKDNISRVTSWIINSLLLNVNQINIAFVARMRKNEANAHKILHVEKKSISDIVQFFNFKKESCFVCLHFILNKILNLENNGSYILHKEGFKSDLTLFRLSNVEA